MQVTYQTTPPDKDQYAVLFETTGWNREYHATADELAQVIANSHFLVAAYAGDLLVGFGRLLTDGLLHAMIYDMIIRPDYQGQGIGGQILQRLLDWCAEAHIRDIQLFCARGKRAFYEKYGFVARSEDAPGMQLRRSLQ